MVQGKCKAYFSNYIVKFYTLWDTDVMDTNPSNQPETQSETEIAIQIEPSVDTQTQILPSLNPTVIVKAPTQKSGFSNKTVAIPPNWQQFTATDPDFGIKTTMSLPPGFSFNFTGSEFTIQNN